MKKIILLLLIILTKTSIIAQSHYYIIPYQRFGFSDIAPDTPVYTTNKTKTKEIIEVPTFQVSHQIKVKEYQKFLESMKSQLDDEAYQQLLPDSSFFKKETFQKYIFSDEYESYPIVAVTWESAIRFCQWKTQTENQGDSIRFMYRLPTRHEWLAAKRFYDTSKSGHDYGTCFADWTYNKYQPGNKNEIPLKNYDTSIVGVVDSRLFLGKSFLMYTDNMDKTGYRQYVNQSYPDIAFRCVKVHLAKPKGFIPGESNVSYFKDDEPEYHLLSEWGLLHKVVTEPPNTEKWNTFAIDRTFDSKKDNNYLSYAYYRMNRKDKFGIRFTGEVRNGKKYGDWYFFNRKGKLKKHIYFSSSGKRKKMPVTTFHYKNNEKTKRKIKQNFFEFADSLLRLQEEAKNAVTSKKYFFQVKNGLKHGCFLYSDYKINIAGNYTGNTRTGEWGMWNNDGELMLQRNYNNSFDFTTIYTTAPQNKLTDILQNGGYSLKRNESGYYNYFELDENDLIATKVIWRTLSPENNKLLFENNFLLKSILPLIDKGLIPVYKINDFYYYKDTVKVKNTIQEINYKTHNVVFRVKEINIIDRIRGEMECRALEICILTKNTDTGKEEDLFLIYIPDTRKYFAQINLSGTNLPTHIKTLDDVFFFCYYTGNIYAEANYANWKLSDYVQGDALEIETKKIENSILDMSFSPWKYLIKEKPVPVNNLK